MPISSAKISSKQIEERGLPTLIYVQNDRACAMIKGIADRLNISLAQEETLPVLEDTLGDFYEQNAEQQNGEARDSDITAFLEQLADPVYLAVLSDDILKQIAGAVGQIPPEALLQVCCHRDA